MSNLTLTRSRIGVSPDPYDPDLVEQRAYVSVHVGPRGTEQGQGYWQRMSDALREGLAREGFRQPEAAIEGVESPSVSWITVAPGIIVRADEFEARYGGIDLEGLRQRMTPSAFRAFVRHIGAIPGRDGVDVDELLSETPE